MTFMNIQNPVLITGGCGYIGSHIVYDLIDRHIPVVVVDNLSNSARDAIPSAAHFHQADILDKHALEKIFAQTEPRAVIHLAALLSTEESVEKPAEYYRVNVTGTQNVIDACLKYDVPKLIFSSTAAVYAANPKPLTEDSPLGPVSPYGHSKLMAEQMLRDITAATELHAVILRYFNVAGADAQMRTGQGGNKTTHLIARACEAAANDIDALEIYGDDYATPDGTCIRDYIHVGDIATAHRIALQKNFKEKCAVFNCGYGHGYSVREIIDTFKKITKIDFPVKISPRRAGDLTQLVADSTALREAANWQPEHDDIGTVIQTAWGWYQRERLKK